MPRLFRFVIPVLLLSFAAAAASAAGNRYADGLRPPLGDVLDAASPDSLVPVSVVLRDQVPRETIRRAVTGLSGDLRRARVTGLLKAAASRGQAPLLAELRALESVRAVARVRPLWIGNVIGIDATPAVIRQLASRPDVDYVNFNPKVDVFLGAPGVAPGRLDPAHGHRGGATLGDGFAEIECGVDLMGAPDVWNDLGFNGDGAVIAVIDTGVCYTHPDIQNQIWVNPAEDLDGDGVVMDPDDMNGVDDDGNGFVDDLIGWNFDLGNNDPDDNDSHGSHVAGTVAGDGTSGTQAGMAPGAKIMVIRVGVQFSDEVDVWNAMQYAADNGADAISMSLGWPHNQNPDRATWRQNSENTIDAGTAMVIAAGNEGDGNEPDNVRTPGDVPRVISVGATNCTDLIASFSSRGPVSWEDVPPYNDHSFPPGLVKPDVSAPGVGTKSHSFCSGYSNKSGTSMATPHVAGAVALMLSANPNLTHDDLKIVLENTSLDLGDPGKDNVFGAGRVDAFAAVSEVFGLTVEQVDTDDADPDYGNADGGVDTGELITMTVRLRNQQDDLGATNIRGWLETETPGVELVHDYAEWPDIDPLGFADSLAPHFSFTVDQGCNYVITFRMTLEYDDRRTGHVFSVRVGTSFERDLIVDDFESDQGWTAGGSSVTGQFLRTDPDEVKDSSRNVVQPEDDATPDPGTDCWVTGNNDNGAGSDDVDAGVSHLFSPVLDATDFEFLTLDYSRWFHAVPTTAPASDFFRVHWTTDGVVWNPMETINQSEAVWTQSSLTFSSLAFESTLQIRFTVEDSPTVLIDSVVEGLVDDVAVRGSRIECEPFVPPAAAPPNPVGDTLVARRTADDDVRLEWAVPVVDASHDVATRYRIYRSTAPDSGFAPDGASTEPFHVEFDEALDPATVYFLVVSENGGGSSGEEP